MTKILVRYAEIGLKGKNLSFFENQLIDNLKLSLGVKKEAIKRLRKQILITVADSLINQSIKNLQNIFGVAWFALVMESASDLESLKKTVSKLAKEKIDKKDTFAVKAHRLDKTLSFTSQKANVVLGETVRQVTGAKVDLSNPDKTIYLDIGKDKTFIYLEKIAGPGGLPVGSSGKVLSLLSGGFDSIAASYFLAKRGAQVDFAHFHVFADWRKVGKSKIKTISDKLKVNTYSQKLWLFSYLPFQMAVLDLPKDLVAHELVVFRRLMVKTACLLAKHQGYEALVLGDSLGQVASQTLSNLAVVDEIADLPLFRPLIGMDKKEIIALVRKLDLEKEAIKSYKDCCSLVTRSPATQAHDAKIKAIEAKIKINQLSKTIADEAQIINL